MHEVLEDEAAVVFSNELVSPSWQLYLSESTRRLEDLESCLTDRFGSVGMIVGDWFKDLESAAVICCGGTHN